MLKVGEIEWHAEQLQNKVGRGIPVNIDKVASVLGFSIEYNVFDDKTISAILDYDKHLCIVRNDPRNDFKRLCLAHAMAYFIIYQHADQKKKQTKRTLSAWSVGDKEEVRRLATAILVPRTTILETSNLFDRRGCPHEDLVDCESKTACLAKTYGIPTVAMAKRLQFIR